MKQIHGETFRADFHFSQSLTSMFLHLELSALFIKSDQGVQSPALPVKVWSGSCVGYGSQRGDERWQETSGCAELCSGRSLILLWAAPWCLWVWASHWELEETGRIDQNGAILERADFSCFLFLLWKTSWSGIMSTVILILGFCFICLVFFLSSPTVGTGGEYYSKGVNKQVFSVSCGSFILVNLKLHRLFQEALI